MSPATDASVQLTTDAGVLKLDSGKRLGVIRIAHFGEDGYPEVCREMWKVHAPKIEEIRDNLDVLMKHRYIPNLLY